MLLSTPTKFVILGALNKDNQLSPLPKTNKPIALMILLMMLFDKLLAYTSLTNTQTS